ncbi:MAG: transglutaminase-like domain-containing protein, partial [bacterium]
MKKLGTFLALFCILIGISCNQGEHFISDRPYREKVKAQFKVRSELAKHRSDTLFGVLRTGLSTTEFEALEFLFAYSSLNDLADYSGEFFLKNVRASLAAKDTFSWGKTIPEEIFRHFVLPVRVNNENLDSSRWVFFAELKDRIKGMTMKDAALEVNHWCHEKVSYRASDSRTSSPLVTVKTGHGRCGEESTFTTASMRSVGIPARQCYTPRWAHGDDNHAWVEVWVDGKWHYLGACEPEPDLDIAWFSAPARRAMLVNTTVFGDYTGPEEVLLKDPLFTRINVLPNYTETKRIWAKVLDVQQHPVPNAAIEFQLYNYAEFYPLLRTTTNQLGLASLLTGYGDLLIWAAHEGKFGFAKADVRQHDTVFIYLELTPEDPGGMNLDFVPPAKQEIQDHLTDSMRAANSERLKFEDQLRASYETTFIDSAKTYRLAPQLNVDSRELWDVLRKSRGNWREIIQFISDTPDSLRQWIFPLLHAVSEKDLRDIDLNVLLDAMLSVGSWQLSVGSSQSPVTSHQSLVTSHQSLVTTDELVVKYILNPRVDNELLKPFHSYFLQVFDP